jgi:integrase
VNKVKKLLRDGSIATYYYHRGTKRKLNGEPGSAQFLQDYAAAQQLTTVGCEGTFQSLVRDYSLSVEFGKLASSTQREYRRMLTRLEEKFCDLPFAALEDARIRQDFMTWRAEIARTSGDREADNRLSILSAMLSWAKEHGRIFHNHVKGFRRIHKSDRSELIWLPGHIDDFMRVAPVELQRALIIALHTGQRQSDILKLTWNSYDGALISLRQGKGTRRVDIPCTRALKQLLDGLQRDSAVILTTKTGRPWKARHFKAQWERASKAAGIKDLHFHDLRGTAVTMLAEAGCTTPQIASITGHSLKTVTSILDRYLARTRVLAGEAIARFENARSTAFANQLQTTERHGRPTKIK